MVDITKHPIQLPEREALWVGGIGSPFGKKYLAAYIASSNTPIDAIRS